MLLDSIVEWPNDLSGRQGRRVKMNFLLDVLARDQVRLLWTEECLKKRVCIRDTADLIG